MSSTPADGAARPSREPGSRETPDPPDVPDRSDDDRGVGWGDPPDDDEERLLRERPPHW